VAGGQSSYDLVSENPYQNGQKECDSGGSPIVEAAGPNVKGL
jgi:hypothetical protein